MDNRVNTQEIERRAFLSYHKDGILDIYLGILIISFSFFFLVEPSFYGVFSGTIVLFPILYRESKKSITFPRLGYVKFSEKKGRSRNSLIILFGLLSLSIISGLVVFNLGNLGDFYWIQKISNNWQWFFALLSLVLFSVFAYITDLQRLYYYGTGSFLLFVSSNFFDVNGFYIVLILGLGVTLTGFILLWRFIKDYPLKRSASE